MKIGRIRRRITIKKRTTVADGYGGQTEAWTTLRADWAAIRRLSGAERVAAAQTQAQEEVEVVLRYATDVSPLMQVVTDQGETLQVNSVVADEARRELHLRCAYVRR